MDFDSFTKAGVALGSGALLICDEDTCVVDLAKVLLNFFRKESCGKCNPCRIGNQRAFEILTNISEGTGQLKDLDDMLLLSDNLYQLSNCGLGQTAGAPIRDILTYFRAEVEAHIRLKVCPAGICPMSGKRTTGSMRRSPRPIRIQTGMACRMGRNTGCTLIPPTNGMDRIFWTAPDGGW